MSFEAGELSYRSAEEALERLQSILLSRVEQKLGPEEELEYRALRRSFMSEPSISPQLSQLVRGNPDLGGVWGVLRDHSDKWENRRQFVREQMRGALQAARSSALAPVRSSTWTGIASKEERLTAARKLLPVAMATVDGLLAELDKPQGNGGPPLDERAEAIENLRQLHVLLGQIIREIESETATPLNQRLLDEAAGYLIRFGSAVRGDPMPFLVSAGLFAIFTTLGAGEVGSYVAGIASVVRKNSDK